MLNPFSCKKNINKARGPVENLDSTMGYYERKYNSRFSCMLLLVNEEYNQ